MKIGVDLATISRFYDKDLNFVKHVLTNKEIEEYNKIFDKENKAKYLASRWAIKEAIYKADNSLYHFWEIEINKVDKKYQHDKFEISTSHENDLVIAIVTEKK